MLVLIVFQITPLLMSEVKWWQIYRDPHGGVGLSLYTRSFQSYVVGMLSAATANTSLTTLS